MRLTSSVVALTISAGLVPATAQAQSGRVREPRVPRTAAYQGQNATEVTERFSRKIRIGRDGRFNLLNIAGDIVISSGPGDEVSIEAVKRGRGDPRLLATVLIEVDSSGGRVDVRTSHTSRNDRVSVDYTITLPASTAVEAKSVSGGVRVTGVQGPVRIETISGNLSTSATPRLELAKTVSGNVDVTDVTTERDLSVSSISGTVRGKNVKAHALELLTVSGDLIVTDAVCDRLQARSVSGNIEYSGSLARNGRYDFTSHSGDLRLTLPDSPGFHLTANTFSGTIRSELPLTPGGDAGRDRRGRGRNQRAIEGTFGDGSAVVSARTFSGDLVIVKR